MALRVKYEVDNAHLTIYFQPILGADQLGRFWWKFAKLIFSGKDDALTESSNYFKTFFSL